MRRILLLAVVAFAAAAMADTVGLALRTSAHGRTWQVNLAPSEPLVWVWPGKATAATLTVTSHLGRVQVNTYDISRGDGDDTGSWTLSAGDGESLHDLVLDIKNGTETIETFTARVVYLPSSFDVLPEDSSAWRGFKNAISRPIPYDEDWSTNGAPVTLTLTPGGDTVSVALEGTSGFEPLDAWLRLGDYAGPFTAALSFNGTEEISATLVRRMSGILLRLR